MSCNTCKIEYHKNVLSPEESIGPIATGHSWKKYWFNSETAEKGLGLGFVNF